MKRIINDIAPLLKSEHCGHVSYYENPMIELFNKGLITKVGNGIFVMEGVLVDIIDKIDESLCKIAKKMKAKTKFRYKLIDN